MKTEDLITMLATGEGAVRTPPAMQRYAVALAWGAAGAFLLLLVLLRIRADLAQAILLPMFWGKFAFVASLVAGSLFATLRLSRPGAQTGRVPVVLALPVVGIWLVAAFVLSEGGEAERAQLFFGQTWKSCPWLIAMLSLPAFVAILRTMQGLAPTRPRQAGFAAGLLAGSLAALVYCLHCPEMGAPFIGFWYLLGMLIPAGLGALLGNRLLRW